MNTLPALPVVRAIRFKVFSLLIVEQARLVDELKKIAAETGNWEDVERLLEANERLQMMQTATLKGDSYDN